MDEIAKRKVQKVQFVRNFVDRYGCNVPQEVSGDIPHALYISNGMILRDFSMHDVNKGFKQF